jgi:hypothetical protein
MSWCDPDHLAASVRSQTHKAIAQLKIVLTPLNPTSTGSTADLTSTEAHS